MESNHLYGAALALASAFFWATNDIFNKKALQKGYDENFVLWIRFPLGALLLLPLGLQYWDLNRAVILTTLLWLPLEILASIFFIKAIKYAPLSLAMPFFSFMPLFSALTGWFVLGEKIEPRGLLGIGLIVYGSILLSGRDFTGFLRINRGVFYALLSAFLFGVNVVIGKIAVVESNQFFFAWYYCLVMSFGLLPFVKRFPQKRELLNPLFPVIGFFFSAGMVTYTWAYLYTYASYVASLERTAILLDVLYGRLIFGEKVRNAFRASLMMLSGTVLLTL